MVKDLEIVYNIWYAVSEKFLSHNAEARYEMNISIVCTSIFMIFSKQYFIIIIIFKMWIIRIKEE